MDCFEQERVRSVPSGRDMTQYHFNVEARDRLFDEIDKLRRYKGVSKQEKQRLFQNVVTEFLSNRFV